MTFDTYMNYMLLLSVIQCGGIIAIASMMAVKLLNELHGTDGKS